MHILRLHDLCSNVIVFKNYYMSKRRCGTVHRDVALGSFDGSSIKLITFNIIQVGKKNLPTVNPTQETISFYQFSHFPGFIPIGLPNSSYSTPNLIIRCFVNKIYEQLIGFDLSSYFCESSSIWLIDVVFFSVSLVN
jgi:hypothetical protein